MPSTEETTFDRLTPISAGLPAFETQPYTFVTIEVQTGDRNRVEFRREYDATTTEPTDALDSLLASVRTYLAAARGDLP